MNPICLNLEADGYSASAQQMLEEIFEYRAGFPDGLTLPESERVEVLVTRLGTYLDRKYLQRFPNLKVIATATTGLNHINKQDAEGQGIQIISLQGESEFLSKITPTAELHWGLLLSLLRHLPEASRHVLREGGWDRNQFLGTQLSGKTIGIVGFGRLGRIIADYAKAFRMRIVAHDVLSNLDHPAVDAFVGLHELAEKSDVISVNLSLNQSSYRLLDKNFFKRLRQGSVLVNTARGEVIDEDALVDALEEGRLSAVGVDVLSNEVEDKRDFLKKNRLWNYAQGASNVLVTPHIGGACPDAMRSTEEFIASKVIRFFTATTAQVGKSDEP